jgi:hypothetical protein
LFGSSPVCVTRHEHSPVEVDDDGEHEHRRCSECSQLLCAASTWTRAVRQVREVTGTVVEVRSTLHGPKASTGEGLQTRSVLITSTRCSDETFTSVEATPWL